MATNMDMVITTTTIMGTKRTLDSYKVATRPLTAPTRPLSAPTRPLIALTGMTTALAGMTIAQKIAI